MYMYEFGLYYYKMNACAESETVSCRLRLDTIWSKWSIKTITHPKNFFMLFVWAETFQASSNLAQ